MKITFDEEKHIYRDDSGERLISITQILDQYFRSEKLEKMLNESSKFLSAYQAAGIRGTKIHGLTEKIDHGFITYEEAMAEAGEDFGYILSYQKFMEVTKPEILMIERKLGHPIYRFAGRLDRVYSIKSKISLADIKTPLIQYPPWKLQLAAQKLLLDSINFPVDICGSLMLRKDGEMAKFKDYTKDVLESTNAFISAMNVHNWKIKYL